MRKTAVAVLIMSLAAAAQAQQKLVESIEVRVVNVDVVVTDHEGKPVVGLTRDDFEVFENGKKQVITNLYEVRPESREGVITAGRTADGGAPAPAAAPPEELRVRRIVMFVDNYSLHPMQRNQVLKSLTNFVDNHMRPNDEAALVTWNNSTQIVTPFTTDKAALKEGIRSLSERSRAAMSIDTQMDLVRKQAMNFLDQAMETANTRSGGKSLSMTYESAYNLSKGVVDEYAQESRANVQKILDGLEMTMASLAGVEGKKVLVFAGAHLPERPGLELYYWLNQLYAPVQKYLSPMAAFQETAHTRQTWSIEKLARQANANGVTLYMIDAADTRSHAHPDQIFLVDQDEQFLTFTNTASAYQTLARMTGGFLLADSSNFDLAFDAVARDFSAYYSLGYRPAPGEGDSRKIVVKTFNPTYNVRSRRNYTPKSAEQEIRDKVLANIYHGGMKGEWPIEIHAGHLEKDGSGYRLPIEVLMSSKAVTLIRDGDKLVGGFSVHMMVGNDLGTSKLTTSPQKISIPPEAEKELRAGPLSFKAMIRLRPGPATLSIAVVDEVSNTAGFAKARVVGE